MEFDLKLFFSELSAFMSLDEKSYSSIIAHMVSRGFDVKFVSIAFSDLIKVGEVYECKKGFYKLM